MKFFLGIFVVVLVGDSQASIFDSFTKATTLKPVAPASASDPIAQNSASPPAPNSMVSTVMDNVWEKFLGVDDVLDKAVAATSALGQGKSLQQLQAIKNRITEMGETFKNMDYHNTTQVSEMLLKTGQELTGLSGNATQVKDQLLHAGIKALADGTLCKTPQEIAASLAQQALGTVMSNLPGVLAGATGMETGTNTHSSKSLGAAAALVGTVAKATEGTGSLAQGLGVAMGVAKCVGNLAPYLMFLG